jgi:hypothetical protein
LKGRIRAAQVKAALAVSRELIALYWEIGLAIVERQEREGWGRSVVDRLAADLQSAFPGVEGFSPRKVWRMRSLYLAWTQDMAILPQAVAELDGATPLERRFRSRLSAATMRWSNTDRAEAKRVSRDLHLVRWIASYLSPWPARPKSGRDAAARARDDRI